MMAKQIPNDMIHFAMIQACKLYGGDSDGMFTNAALSKVIMEIAGHSGVVDGEIIRLILTGRSDVVALEGGGHYQLVK